MTELFRNVNASSARFFFHSFPRRRQDESRNTQIEKGSRIAKNILDNGLLLAPENYDLPVIGNDGSTADSFTAVQRRICFTELEPEALEGHSQVFGPFALAYRIEDLRRIGALPVSYIPLESGGYLSRLPIEMLGGLIDAHRIAGTLLRVQTQLSQSPALGLKYREKEINFTPEQADVIRKFLNTLIDSAATNLDMTDARLRTMASCFYPTENPKYTDPLHYYRQREWRVVAGPFTYNGELCSRVATSQQAQMLLEIDCDFFSKRLSFFDAAAKLGEKVSDTIANRCHFLRRVGDLDVVALARCLVIPDDAPETSQLEQLYRERGVDVIRQSDVAKLALLPS